MASKKVGFHEDAALEYEAAFEWYLERSILAASKFAAAVNPAPLAFPVIAAQFFGGLGLLAITGREVPARPAGILRYKKSARGLLPRQTEFRSTCKVSPRF